MTIPTTVEVVAPHVPIKARAREGVQNPFISLQSLETLCKGDETLMELLRDMVTYSLRYAETVCQFEIIALRGNDALVDGTRAQIDAVRKNIHNTTIDAINILARTLVRTGKDGKWITKMRSGRTEYGKFAILIAFEYINQPKP